MDFFEFWFWHRWFYRDDPDYNVGSFFGGLLKLVLIFSVLMILIMFAQDCQHEDFSDEQQTSQPAQVKEQPVKQHQQVKTSDSQQLSQSVSKQQPSKQKVAKQAATKREEAKVNALAPSAPVAVLASVKEGEVEVPEVPEKTYASRQYIEVYTAAGEVKLYVGMPKDSVKMKMGNPYTTSAYDSPYSGLKETWEYMERNKYVSEFTIEFLNGRLKSLRQYRER